MESIQPDGPPSKRRKLNDSPALQTAPTVATIKREVKSDDMDVDAHKRVGGIELLADAADGSARLQPPSPAGSSRTSVHNSLNDILSVGGGNVVSRSTSTLVSLLGDVENLLVRGCSEFVFYSFFSRSSTLRVRHIDFLASRESGNQRGASSQAACPMRCVLA